PIRNLQVPGARWRKTLRSLQVRYRRPYTARHSSVSWNLMVGKKVLWVAKQHGHSTMTMLRAYGAWTEGTAEADVLAIERSMNLMPRQVRVARPVAPCRYGRRAVIGAPLIPKALAVDQPIATGTDEVGVPVSTTESPPAATASPVRSRKIKTQQELAGVAGFEPAYGGIKTRCLTTWRHP